MRGRLTRINRFRHRAEVQEVTETQDDFGDPVKTWATVSTVPAAIEPMQGSESFRSDQEIAKRPVRVLIRYRSDVTVEHRIKFGSRFFEIQSVTDPDFRGRVLELMCEETHP